MGAHRGAKCNARQRALQAGPRLGHIKKLLDVMYRLEHLYAQMLESGKGTPANPKVGYVTGVN